MAYWADMQLSLWGQAEPALEHAFTRLRRVQLDDSSWLDYAPGFVSGHQTLFERLMSTMRWKQERRLMYEREVDVPRLYASAPEDGPLDPLLAEAAAALAQRYGASFDRVGLAHYRDGRDSVAWHRDHLPRDRPTLVAIVSLGAPRKLLVRPFGGGASRAYALGAGDLFVMGGMCQASWEHAVPKQKHAEPRMSCVFRHVYDAAGR
ncbi:MAG: alkylated repair protein [Myxococcaceae bacterium]|nr:alkylated repair protein [Myxococcaceae bacterium]